MLVSINICGNTDGAGMIDKSSLSWSRNKKKPNCFPSQLYCGAKAHWTSSSPSQKMTQWKSWLSQAERYKLKQLDHWHRLMPSRHWLKCRTPRPSLLDLINQSLISTEIRGCDKSNIGQTGCGKTYTGQTGRLLGTRLKEHRGSVRRHDTNIASPQATPSTGRTPVSLDLPTPKGHAKRSKPYIRENIACINSCNKITAFTALINVPHSLPLSRPLLFRPH